MFMMSWANYENPTVMGQGCVSGDMDSLATVYYLLKQSHPHYVFVLHDARGIVEPSTETKINIPWYRG